MKFIFKIFKWVTILLLILISGYLIIASYYIYLSNQGEIVLIPDGYIGDIIISYDNEQGLYEKVKNNMIYRIPESGIYKTKLSYDKKAYMDLGKVRFYYIDDQQNRKEIFYLFKYDEIDTTFLKNKIVAMNLDRSLSDKDSNLVWPILLYQIDTFKNLIKHSSLTY